MLTRCSRALGVRAMSSMPRQSTAISGKREMLRYDVEYDEFTLKGKSKWVKHFNNTHSIQRFPGSRYIELSRTKAGNPLSGGLFKELVHEFLALEQNHSVNVTLLGTTYENSTDVFSTGLCEKALKIDWQRTLKQLYTLARVFQVTKSDVAGVLSSKMPGTVLGLLLNTKYRLGTPSLEVSVDELTRGYVPGGGMAFHFSHKAGLSGLMMSRYLAYSQRTIQSADLFEMGILTHLVQENPHFSFCNALGHSIGSSSQAYQQLPADADAVADLLDAMHVGDDDGQEDPLDDPHWDKMMLIKIQKVAVDDIKHHVSDIERFYDELAACFNAPTLEEAVNRVATAAPEQLYPPLPFGTVVGLNEIDNFHWASETLLSLEKCDPLAAKAWYKLTLLTGHKDISQKEALQLEEHINLGLVPGKKQRMMKMENVERGVGPSDRNVVQKNIVARLNSVSNDDVDALFRGSPVDLSKFRSTTTGDKIIA